MWSRERATRWAWLGASHLQPSTRSEAQFPGVCWPELLCCEVALQTLYRLSYMAQAACSALQGSKAQGLSAPERTSCNSLLCAGPALQELLCDKSFSNLELLSDLQQWKQHADSDESDSFRKRLLGSEAARQALAGRIIQVSQPVAHSSCLYN